MGQPSTTHERTHRSSSHHHHHRTISSTTLLLALSLILAVLAITLSIPSYNSPSNAAVPAEVTPPAGGIWGYFTPKRAQGLLARESAVALREYELARREAELFGTTLVAVPPAPAPAAVVVGTPCAPEVHTVRVVTETVTVEALPTSTIVKEVVKEVEPLAVPPPPWWKDQRVENLYEREQKVSQREKEVGSREETVGKRESDAAKREAWVMEQLINLGQDKIVEEEVVYETPGRRKPKTIPIDIPAVTTEYISTRTVTISEPDPVEPVILPTHTTTVTVAMPSATRLAAHPAPEVFETPDVTTIGRTTEVPVIVESTTTINVAQTQTVRVVQAVEDDLEEEYDYDYDYEDYEEPEQVAVKTVRRVKAGRRNFKKWWSE